MATPPVLVLHPSAVTLVATPRGRAARPFYERLATPAPLPDEDVRVPGRPTRPDADVAHLHILDGTAWRSFSGRSRPGGPMTSLDRSDLVGFLSRPEPRRPLAAALGHTPVLALVPGATVRERAEGLRPERGGEIPDGHAVASEERARSILGLRRFLAEDVAFTRDRILVRVCVAAVVTPGGIRLGVLPDPALSEGLAVPAHAAPAALAALAGRKPDKSDARTLSRIRACGWDDAPLLRESVNLLARQACAALQALSAHRFEDAGLRALARAAASRADGPWRARCR